MREKIANILIDNKGITKASGLILTLLKEEIEKVESPYEKMASTKYEANAFNVCRQKILALLR